MPAFSSDQKHMVQAGWGGRHLASHFQIRLLNVTLAVSLQQNRDREGWGGEHQNIRATMRDVASTLHQVQKCLSHQRFCDAFYPCIRASEVLGSSVRGILLFFSG